MLSSSRPLGLLSALFAALLLHSFFALTFAAPLPDTGDSAPQISDPSDGLLGQDVDFWLNDVVDMFADKGLILDLDELKGTDGFTKMINDDAAKDITTENIVDMLTLPEDPEQMPKIFQDLATDPVVDALDKSATLVTDLTEETGRSDDANTIMEQVEGSTDQRDVFKSKGRSVLARILKAISTLISITPEPPVDAVKEAAHAFGQMAADQEKVAITKKTGNVVMIGAETPEGSQNRVYKAIMKFIAKPDGPPKWAPLPLPSGDPTNPVRLLQKGAKAISAAFKVQPDGKLQGPDGSVVDAPTAESTKPGAPTTPTDPNAPTTPGDSTEPTDPNAPVEPEDPNTPTEVENPNVPTEPESQDPTKPKPKPKTPTKPTGGKPPKVRREMVW